MVKLSATTTLHIHVGLANASSSKYSANVRKAGWPFYVFSQFSMSFLINFMKE